SKRSSLLARPHRGHRGDPAVGTAEARDSLRLSWPGACGASPRSFAVAPVCSELQPPLTCWRLSWPSFFGRPLCRSASWRGPVGSPAGASADLTATSAFARAFLISWLCASPVLLRPVTPWQPPSPVVWAAAFFGSRPSAACERRLATSPLAREQARCSASWLAPEQRAPLPPAYFRVFRSRSRRSPQHRACRQRPALQVPERRWARANP